MENLKTIIWDWNGTLLDDVHICLEGINYLLKKRDKPELSLIKYKDIFTFPVRDYYLKAGFRFDIEPFDRPAMEFIEIYSGRIKSARLFPDTIPILNYFREKGYQQALLSAMEHNFLLQTLIDKKIIDYFSQVTGIKDHFANSKATQAASLLKKLNSDAERTLIIGDTIHDYEIAEELNCRVILVSRGHQSEERLKKLNCPVINNLEQLRLMF